MPSIKLMNKLSLSEYTALAGNIPKYCPNATFTVASETFTAPEAVAFVNALLQTSSAVATAKTDLETARTAEAAAMSANGAKVKAIRDTVELMFSDNATTLAAFEITPRKPRAPLSTAARAAADAKAKATRLARGTTSKKQKATIDGNVTGVTITPVVGPKPVAVTPPSTTTSSPASPVVTPVAVGTAAGTTQG